MCITFIVHFFRIQATSFLFPRINVWLQQLYQKTVVTMNIFHLQQEVNKFHNKNDVTAIVNYFRICDY